MPQTDEDIEVTERHRRWVDAAAAALGMDICAVDGVHSKVRESAFCACCSSRPGWAGVVWRVPCCVAAFPRSASQLSAVPLPRMLVRICALSCRARVSLTLRCANARLTAGST